jgi:PIN domain nuclease of toxin-antitoxin system
MIAAVVDTHALIWYLAGDRRLSDSAKQFISRIAKDGNQVAVSTISLIEITYLAEKGRLAADWPTRVITLFDKANTPFVKASVDLEIAKTLASLAGLGITDMPDRIIAATSTYFNVPLVTRDRAITNSAVNTLW